MRALVVEDDDDLSELVRARLSNEGFAVDAAMNLEAAADALAVCVYDVIVLDIGLPDGDGVAFLRARRRDGLATPVLLLTARDGIEDRVAGLDAGADDYLVKPFAGEELTARLRALLRRPGQALSVVLRLGALEYDTAKAEARVGEVVLSLGSRERAALATLLREQGSVVRRERLEAAIWSFEEEVTPNALEALISRLRRRLKDVQAGVLLDTVRGVGYVMMESE